jgi:hypothetical protein
MLRIATEQADGLMLPPLLAHLAPGIREPRPPSVRMNAPTRYEGDYGDFDAFSERIAELREAGYGLLGGAGDHGGLGAGGMERPDPPLRRRGPRPDPLARARRRRHP